MNIEVTKSNFSNRIKRFRHILLNNSTSDTEDLSAFYVYYYRIKEGNIQKQMFNCNNSINVILHNSIVSLNVYTNVHCYVSRLMAIANLYYLPIAGHTRRIRKNLR